MRNVEQEKGDKIMTTIHNLKLYTDEDVFKISYHFMHFYPSTICVMLVPKSLLERTKDVLSKDPMLIIDSIKNMED